MALKGFGPDIKGYVHANHLGKLFDNIFEYPEGTELDGTLLYVLPVLNYPFFMITEQEKPTWAISFGSLVKNVTVRLLQLELNHIRRHTIIEHFLIEIVTYLLFMCRSCAPITVV